MCARFVLSVALVLLLPIGISAQAIRLDMAQTNGSVLCVAESAGIYYIGGTFTTVINPDGSVVARNRAAAIDASSGFVTAWNPDVDGDVVAIVPSGNTIYLGGAFMTVSGQARSRAAAVDVGGSLLPWDPQPNGTVFSMLLDGTTMYMGGAFFQIAGINRFFLGAVSASGAGSLLAWNPSADDFVFSLAKQGNTIYAGGQFLNVGGMGRPRVAAINATTGISIGWNPASNNILLSVAADSSRVYAGGFFATIGGGARQGIAALDPASGLLLPAFNANCNNGALKILPRGSQLIVGGNYTSIGGSALANLAIIDAATGNATQWTNSGTNGQIEFNGLAAVSGEPTVLASGQFTTIGGTPRGYFAVLDQPSPSATYSPTLFTESAADNGTIDSIGSITLNRTSWLPPFGTILSTGTHYTVSGVPNGLSVFLRVVGRQRVELQFLGRAASHTSSDAASIAFTFTNAAVQNGNASLINGLNTQNLRIQFIDSATQAALPPAPSPIIQSFSPSSGGQGTQVLIRGSRLTNVLGVRFGGVLARTSTVVSDSLIIATVDNGTSGRIELLRRDTSVFSAQVFTFVETNLEGIIANISQNVGTVGSRIVLTGRGFTGTTDVRFGGVSVQSFRVDSDSQITVVLGGSASGTITIVRPQGTLFLNDAFTYLPPPEPVITRLLPRPVLTGDGNYELTVVGRNLALWGEYTVEALSTTANLSPTRLMAYNLSSTSAQLTVPLAFRQIGQYRLLVNIGSAVLSTTFSVSAAAAPVISTQSVVSTLANGEAFTVLFGGSGFFTRGTATLLLNGVLAKGNVLDSSRFWVEIPRALNIRGGNYRVRITNFDGQSTEAVVRVVPREGPLITDVEAQWQNNPDDSPRLEFVVKGINFMPPLSVRVTSRTVHVVQEDTMSVRVVIPPTLPRPQLDEPPGVLVLTNSDTQIYGFRLAPTLFYPVQPVIERVGGLVTTRRNAAFLIGLPLEGTGFQPGSRVFLDTIALEVLSVSSRRCVVRIPQTLVFPEQPEKRYTLRFENPATRNARLSTSAQVRLSFATQTASVLPLGESSSAFDWAVAALGNAQELPHKSIVQTAPKPPQNAIPRQQSSVRRITIFPQPAADYLVIDTGSEEHNGLSICTKARIYDTFGLLRYEHALDENCRGNIVLPLSSLPRGMYILELVGKTARYCLPFVKQ